MSNNVSAKQIIEYAKDQYTIFNKQTQEELQQTVGGLNGIDMQTYTNGYTDALRHLINFFETRV